jgi:lysophospholipase L1-like esterase
VEANASHTIELWFRAATLIDRWTTPRPRLRIAGLSLDHDGVLTPTRRRAKRAIGWGDSITEGVGVDGHFTSWTALAPNNAMGTWFPIMAQALDAEFGQLGSGGAAIAVPIPGGLPALVDAWSIFDSDGTSRLSQGRLMPEPDYLFSNLGTNDAADPSAAYADWLRSVRAAAPRTVIFVVVPINGRWRAELAGLVGRLHAAGERRICLIDCPHLQAGASARGFPTSMAFDGCHPTLYGEALFGAAIAVQASRFLATLGEG